MHKIFRLFACNRPVRGACKSILCDLQRAQYYPIPLQLFEILTVHQGLSVLAIKALYPVDQSKTIEGYFAFLISEELGFWLQEDAEHFPDLDLGYEHPERINNAVIDIGAESRHDFASLFAQLDELDCSHVELRCYEAMSLTALDALLQPTLLGRLRSIELLLRYDASLRQNDLVALCKTHQRIARVTVYGAPQASRVEYGGWTLTHVTPVVHPAHDCGQIHSAYFSVNTDVFTEAQHFNTCLNKKVGIDVQGNIKNCPSCQHCYGQLAPAALAKAVAQPEFQAVWHINKDQVEVCCDCEFRYICTDCRVFLVDPGNALSKPAHCQYDPYTGVWGKR